MKKDTRIMGLFWVNFTEKCPNRANPAWQVLLLLNEAGHFLHMEGGLRASKWRNFMQQD